MFLEELFDRKFDDAVLNEWHKTNEAIFDETATLGGQFGGSEAKGILYRISLLQLNLLT